MFLKASGNLKARGIVGTNFNGRICNTFAYALEDNFKWKLYETLN